MVDNSLDELQVQELPACLKTSYNDLKEVACVLIHRNLSLVFRLNFFVYCLEQIFKNLIFRALRVTHGMEIGHFDFTNELFRSHFEI